MKRGQARSDRNSSGGWIATKRRTGNGSGVPNPSRNAHSP